MSDLSNDRLVVLDEATPTLAFLSSSSMFATYPRPPARSSNPHADALGVPPHVRRAVHAAVWADVDAVVLTEVGAALRARVIVELGADRWVSGHRAFADNAPFVS